MVCPRLLVRPNTTTIELRECERPTVPADRTVTVDVFVVIATIRSAPVDERTNAQSPTLATVAIECNRSGRSGATISAIESRQTVSWSSDCDERIVLAVNPDRLTIVRSPVPGDCHLIANFAMPTVR